MKAGDGLRETAGLSGKMTDRGKPAPKQFYFADSAEKELHKRTVPMSFR